MDAPYAEFYAKKLFERWGREMVAGVPFSDLRTLVAMGLEPFEPQAHEIVAVACAVQKLARDMAAPADSPRTRGRMYR